MVHGQGMLWKLSRAHATFLRLLFPFLNAQTCRPWRTSRKSFWTWIKQTRKSLQAGRGRAKCTTSSMAWVKSHFAASWPGRSLVVVDESKARHIAWVALWATTLQGWATSIRLAGFCCCQASSAAISLTAPVVRGDEFGACSLTLLAGPWLCNWKQSAANATTPHHPSHQAHRAHRPPFRPTQRPCFLAVSSTGVCWG